MKIELLVIAIVLILPLLLFGYLVHITPIVKLGIMEVL